jgi:glutaryl-CoA dehydrogenase
MSQSSTKPAFNWEDPFSLETQLTEEERMIRDAAHDYCQGQLKPRVLEANRK